MRLRRKFNSLFLAWSFIEYALARVFTAFINLFPIFISTWMARRVGDIVFLLWAERRKVAISNLAIAFGESKNTAEKKRIALESFRHLMTSCMEFSRLNKFAKISKKHVKFYGIEHLDAAYAAGKGLILAMCHLGPWEYIGLVPYQTKCRAAILGRPIRNPYFYEWIKAKRRMMNLEYIDKDAGPRTIFSRLRQNYGVAVAIDQWAGNGGLWIDFFSKPTSTTPVPAEFAKRTGCTILPAYCVRVRCGKYEVHIEPGMPPGKSKSWVENTTRRLNLFLEDKIRLFPEQWLWTHRRWKERGVVEK